MAQSNDIYSFTLIFISVVYEVYVRLLKFTKNKEMILQNTNTGLSYKKEKSRTIKSTGTSNRKDKYYT